jgi:hypothetical protein
MVNDYFNFWKNAPFYSSKFDFYFDIYEEVFNKLRGNSPTFIEIGIQSGGSLFAWREFFGKNARIIGIDLNPECRKFEDYGFEIYIGDTADEDFLRSVLTKVGKVDAILDDGGHLFPQQINVLLSAAKYVNNDLIVAIEDSSTSFYTNFLNNNFRNKTFIEYAKALSDILHVGFSYVYPDNFVKFKQNHLILELYKNLNSINFHKGITIFNFKANAKIEANLLKNDKPLIIGSDFRYNGIMRKKFLWPNIRKQREVFVGQSGFKLIFRRLKNLFS